MDHASERRFASQSGIAIGPILFIIAILAILAAAIAAGSGSFTAGTSKESDRTRASALIQIGENLKIGVDRLLLQDIAQFGAIDFNAKNADSSSNNVLFSPNGGGITAPSVTLANDPGNDVWYYPTGGIGGLGTASSEQLAVLRVSQGVCTEVNARANALATPAVNDLGDFTSASNDAALLAAWPAALFGKPIGCVQNNNATDASEGYFFYQVLAIR
ncbi:MAG: hypothetical protein SFW62_00565 [Alphaproteobacteria bacterium]|nr:hypothetical protein [Alphaproteobacteria bacterium]